MYIIIIQIVKHYTETNHTHPVNQPEVEIIYKQQIILNVI